MPTGNTIFKEDQISGFLERLKTVGFEGAEIVKTVSMPVIGIAILIFGFRIISRMMLAYREINFLDIFKWFGLVLMFSFYTEIMENALNVIGYLESGISEKVENLNKGETIPEIIDKIQEQTDTNEQTAIKNDPTFESRGMVERSFDHFTDWIIANCTHLLIMFARSFMIIGKEIFLMVLITLGPLSVMLSMFPTFENTLPHWFKSVVGIAFWGITMQVLDMVLILYLKSYLSATNTDGLSVVNLVISIMYIMIPIITAIVVGGNSVNMLNRITSLLALGAAKATNSSSVLSGRAWAGKRGGSYIENQLGSLGRKVANSFSDQTSSFGKNKEGGSNENGFKNGSQNIKSNSNIV